MLFRSLFCEENVQSDKFTLSDLPDYFVPEEGDLKFYKEVRTKNVRRVIPS